MKFLLLALGLALVAASTPRGVPHFNAHLYNQPTFTCFDGSNRLMASSVNDDYCDCEDGSDEPGTSACGNGLFYCENRGHSSQYLLASRVDDGLCDCCDGSDEALVQCSNVCAELGSEARAKAEAEKQKQETGYLKRLEYQAQGHQTHLNRLEKITKLEQEIESHRKLANDLKELKKNAEEIEKQATSIIDEAHKLKVEEYENNVKLIAFSNLDLNNDAIIIVDELITNIAFDSNSDSIVTQEELLEWFDVDESGELNEEEQSLNFEKFTALYDKLPEQIKQPESVGEPPIKEQYSQNVQDIINVANDAREASKNADETLSNIESELTGLRSDELIDFGHNYEFSPLHSNCYHLIDREYKYTLCAFSQVKQEPKHGGGHTTILGNWAGWEGGSGQYNVMLYSNGERCWNGPERSIKVKLECGIEDKIENVLEPSRCEYSMILHTPAVCQQQSHEEL